MKGLGWLGTIEIELKLKDFEMKISDAPQRGRLSFKWENPRETHRNEVDGHCGEMRQIWKLGKNSPWQEDEIPIFKFVLFYF